MVAIDILNALLSFLLAQDPYALLIGFFVLLIAGMFKIALSK